MVIVGLVKDVHAAAALIRVLDDAGFSGEDIDMSAGVLSDLIARGVPPEEAHAFAEGVRRGGAIVSVRTDDVEEAAEAAHIMSEHGALDIDACVRAWNAQPDVQTEHYAAAFGEYPGGLGRIYLDARTTRGRYSGPERRVRNEPYPGANRRAV
jgi:hypothetical protein